MDITSKVSQSLNGKVLTFLAGVLKVYG